MLVYQRVSAERSFGRSLRCGEGAVRGEVFGEVFGLFLQGHSEQQRTSAKTSAQNSQGSAQQNWRKFSEKLHESETGPNTISESTVSNFELSEFFGPHRALGRELSEFLSAYYLCAKANSPRFS